MPRNEPPLLRTLPRLIARLPKDSPHIRNLEKRLYRVKAGYSGEQEIDQYLATLDVPTSMTVLTDIQLSHSPGMTFQIDTLILTEKFILIIDVKNITDKLRFKTNPNQLEQELKTGEVRKMDCPLEQLHTHIHNLQNWLAKRGIQVDIIGRVLLSNSNAHVVEAPPNAPIIYKKGLSVLLRNQSRKPTIHSPKLIKRIEELIRKNSIDYDPFPLCNYFSVDPDSLKRGQLCAKCGETMQYVNHKQRKCIECIITAPNNYSETLIDYFTLINTSISNRECREFLQLKNKDAANYAIKSLPLNKTGNSVATRYVLPKNFTL
jgi:ribosomal protein S27AE